MTETTWTATTITLSKLKPWERNPKRISKAHAARLLDLWERLGQFQTIAIGPAGEVYDGHQRLSVLKAKHGGGYVVQVLQASRPLTEAEREELTIAAHSGTTGSWDWDALAGWDVGNLTAWGLDEELLSDWNAGATALREMLAAEAAPTGEDPGPQLDRAGELREKWHVEPGQVWQVGRHRVMCGNSNDKAAVDMLMGGAQIDGICTDPPYDLDAASVADAFSLCADRAIVLTSDAQAFALAALWRVRLNFVWVHRQPRSFPSMNLPVVYHHLCVALTKNTGVKLGWQRPESGFGSVIRVDGVEFQDGEMGHGKSPLLFAQMMAGFPWRAVADPYLGSGATLIACETSGRQLFGMELDAGNLAITLERASTAGLSCAALCAAGCDNQAGGRVANPV